MRNRGSRFTLGVWRLRVCSLDVAQPFANRSHLSAWGPYGRAYGKFCKRDHFWRFETLRCFVSRGRRGTSWHSDAFRKVWRAVLCGRRNTFPIRFRKMRCSFRGRRSTLDVSCCVFFANRIVRAASSGDKVQIPWQAWHFVRCDENWRKPRTKYRFWGSKFRRFIRTGQRRFWSYKLYENWRTSRRKCAFWCSNVSRLESLVFLWPRHVYRGSCKIYPFWRCQIKL